MSKPLVIVGAGRFARVVLDTIDAADAIDFAGFLDDTMPVGTKICGFPVLNAFAAMHDKTFVHAHAWFIALGDNTVRKELGRALMEAEATIANLIHPSARISRRASLGRGIYIGPFESLGPGAKVGDWVIVEGHGRFGVDAQVGEGAFLGAGVVLNGNCAVGTSSFLGTGTIVSNKVSIGADCIVGANSTVVRDLPDGTTAVGSPARPKPLTRRPFTH
jgi:sugar O-acyltransferase (sialic acid O-acetyltransferase NeuD family)